MSNLKISQLPLYTGNTSGSFLVMNNSGETTTYKVNSNTFLNGIATTSSNTFNGNQTITGSLNVTSPANFKGLLTVTSSAGLASLLGSSIDFASNNGLTGSIIGRTEIQFFDPSGDYFIRKKSGQKLSLGNTTSSLTSITGSLEVTGSINKFQGDVEITGSISGGSNRALAVSGSAYVSRTLFVGNSSVQPAGGIIIAQANSPSIYASGSDAASIYARALPTGSSGTTVNIGMAASGSNSVYLFTNTGTFLQIMSGSVSEPIQLLRTTNITGSVNISTVMTLAEQSPLPTGIVGSLAVSGSNLFYHNGSSWSQIN